MWSRIPGCDYSVLLLCRNAGWFLCDRDIFRHLGPKEMHICIQRCYGKLIEETMLWYENSLKDFPKVKKDTDIHLCGICERFTTIIHQPKPPSYTVTLISQYFLCHSPWSLNCPAQSFPFFSSLVSRPLPNKKIEVTTAICYSFCPVWHRRLSTTFLFWPSFA